MLTSTRRQLLRFAGGLALPAVFLPEWVRAKSYQLPAIVDHNAAPLNGPSGPLRALVGPVAATSRSRLVVRDAEGLHPVVFDDQTEVHRAVGAPTYDLAPPAVARRFRTGDELWIAGKPSADGSLHAVHIDVNFVAFAGGIAAAAGPRHVDARLQIRKSLQFEPQITRLQLAPSGRILKLDATGRYVPARLDELNVGQYIGMNGYRAEDGSFVVTTLLLGNGKSPGQA